MSESEDLELYYILHLKSKGMPEFKDLDEDYRKSIQDTLGFALFRISKEGERVVNYVKGELKKFAEKL